MSFNVSNAIFNQADANRDGAIDRAEFSKFLSGAGAASSGLTGFGSSYNLGYGGLGGAYGAHSGYGSGYGANYGAGYGSGYGANYGLGYGSGYGASYGLGYGAGLGGAVYDSSYGSAALGAGAANASYVVSGGLGYDAASSVFSSQGVVQQYSADASGNFIDSNPEIIRRPAAGGVQTYNQNVAVRFLQPPPVPPPGPIIIREVRPPQPPPPAPLRLRQQAPPLPTPPPLLLRERPPRPPAVIPAQTVIRRLAPIPPPPRSVVVERLPPLPPKPRDVVLERWLPYGPQPRRRTILQRAGAAAQYPRPRNVIIQYAPSSVRIVRQIHRLGVTPANPAAYVQMYGASLLDASTLISQARAAGVVEDISAPGFVSGYSAATYGQDAGALASWSGLEGGAGWSGAGWSGAGWSDAGWSGAGWNDADWSGANLGGAGWSASSGYLGDDYASDASLSWGAGAGLSSSVYESGYGGALGGFGVAGTAFQSADINADGVLDQGEFSQFIQQGL